VLSGYAESGGIKRPKDNVWGVTSEVVERAPITRRDILLPRRNRRIPERKTKLKLRITKIEKKAPQVHRSDDWNEKIQPLRVGDHLGEVGSIEF